MHDFWIKLKASACLPRFSYIKKLVLVRAFVCIENSCCVNVFTLKTSEQLLSKHIPDGNIQYFKIAQIIRVIWFANCRSIIH